MKPKHAVIALVIAIVAVIAAPRLSPAPIPQREGNPAGGKVTKTDAEWRAELTPEQYDVTRRGGTECAFTGKLWDDKSDGVYGCVCCGQPLFDSVSKYNSGTGWPSFTRPVDVENVTTRTDRKLVEVRTEVKCSRCDAHLGHVFPDGPAPSKMRFCINSAALKVVPREGP